MKYDWKALSPTRPLGPDETDGSLYVPRVGEGAAEIDARLNGGLEDPVGIFGPAGAGKSTELAELARRRQRRWVGSLVRLDKVIAYTDTTSIVDVLDAVAFETIRLAICAGVPVSGALGNSDGRFDQEVVKFSGLSGFDLLLAAVREIRAASSSGSVGLMVDGLEKASRDLAETTLAHLERLRGEASVVVVVPMGLATGPSGAILEAFDRVSIGPIVVDGALDPSGVAGFKFLFNVVARRLGISADQVGGDEDTTAYAIRHAIALSGGLVRTCLQLVQKGALYATMRGRPVPAKEDVERAGREQSSFLFRLLKEGDVAALRAVHATNGMELELERRVRFLASGLVLEYATSHGTVARVCPLLEEAILGRREGTASA